MNDMTATPNHGAPLWNLADLYPTPDAWSVEYARIKKAASALDSYKGTLGKSAAAMLKALDAISRVGKETARLYTYAALKADEDLSVAKDQERRQQAGALYTLLSEKTAWLAPEILELGEAKVRAFERENAELAKRHGFFLDNTLRAAPAYAGPRGRVAFSRRRAMCCSSRTPSISQLANSELPFPTVTLSDGTSVRLDQSGYVQYRQSREPRRPQARVRHVLGRVEELRRHGGRRAHRADHGRRLPRQDAQASRTRCRPRSFPTTCPKPSIARWSREANAGPAGAAPLFPPAQAAARDRGDRSNITTSIRSCSPASTSRNSPSPIRNASTLDALVPYGEEYLAFLQAGLRRQDGPIRIRAQHKASGAYMNGSAYDVHPYVLLNHQDDYDSLSTFAHEWGHAVHTQLTTKYQPYEKSHYSTFVAEAASIANEMLLNDYMVKHAKTREEKLFYLGEGVESIRGTFFRQVMLAEFELAIHEEIEAGPSALGRAHDRALSRHPAQILRRGRRRDDDRSRPMASNGRTSRTSITISMSTNTRPRSRAPRTSPMRSSAKASPRAERFLTLLRAGGSDYPYELYKRAGIDMASPAPYQALIARMNRIMDDIEKLLR